MSNHTIRDLGHDPGHPQDVIGTLAQVPTLHTNIAMPFIQTSKSNIDCGMPMDLTRTILVG